MFLLATSDARGIAYIQTMNLDGESNLKTRYARQETTSMVPEVAIISGLIRCEQPNRNIYEFTANMEFKGQRFPLSQSNIILRGCQLKNTERVVGVAVYSGQDTKAMLNTTMSPCKRSRLESLLMRFVELMRFVFGREIYYLAKSAAYWPSILLITVLALLPCFIFKVVHQTFWP